MTPQQLLALLQLLADLRIQLGDALAEIEQLRGQVQELQDYDGEKSA